MKAHNQAAANDPGLPGIDISHHNSARIPIDWRVVRPNFVYIKATEGVTFTDDHYALDIKNARDLGIPCGAYHFAVPKDSAAEQAAFFLRTIGPRQAGDLPPVLDTEIPKAWKKAFSGNKVLAAKKRVDYILEWTKIVEQELGVKPILYMSSSFAGDVFNSDARLNEFLLYVAHYNVTVPVVPKPWRDYTIWQSTDKGAMTGVTGFVDLDWFNGTKDDLDKLRMPGFRGKSLVPRVVRDDV